MKTYIFPRKIYYINATGFTSSTPCPHGGAISSGNGVFVKGTSWPGAAVGSLACDGCLFNRGTELGYVMCNRKKVGEA